MKKILLIFSLLVFWNTAGAYELSVMELSLEPGYRFYSVDRSSVYVNKYSKGESSPSLNLIYKDIFYNGKFSMDIKFLEEDNRNIDIQWDYKDTLKIEAKEYSLVHNKEHKPLVINPAVYDLQSSDEYRLTYNHAVMAVRYKPVLYPFHIRFLYEDIEKEGEIQKRFYGPYSLDGIHTNTEIYSATKKVHLDTRRYQSMIDGLAGGVSLAFNMEYAYLENDAQNTPNGGNIQLNPSLHRQAHALSGYSNQSGQISYAFSLGRSHMENTTHDELNKTNGEYEYKNATAVVSYYPFQTLLFGLKASYENKDEETPDTVRHTLAPLGLPANYKTSPSIPVTRTSVNITMAYNFAPDWSLRANVKSIDTHREDPNNDNKEWKLVNSVYIDGNISKDLKVRATQKIESVQDPYYKSTPNSVYETDLTLEYDINSSWNVYGAATFTTKTNDSAQYYFERERIQNYRLNVMYTGQDEFSLNLYGLLEKSNASFDLHFQSGAVEYGVPYSTTLFNTGVAVNKGITKTLTAFGDVNYQRVYGNYYPETNDEMNLYTGVDYVQYGAKAGSSVKLKDNWSGTIELGFRKYNDRVWDQYDGTVETTFVSLEKRW